MSAFKKAERKQAKLKLAITGPSGSGKTYSALRLATGLGGKIAVIDTENGSASLYSDRFDFDVLTLDAPYENQKYLTAIADAVKAGYDILIIDSLSHQWAGEGGLLNKKEQLDARSGSNSYANWAKMTPEHEKLKSAILHSDIHVIGTMRSKQDYVLETNDKGKQAPKKVGLAPVQRDGMEYEFTTCFDVAMNHEAVASKDRTSLFVDKIFQITEETGKTLKTWLLQGKETPKVETQQFRTTAPTGELPPDEQDRQYLAATAAGCGWSNREVAATIESAYKKSKLSELTRLEFNDLVAHIQANVRNKGALG